MKTAKMPLTAGFARAVDLSEPCAWATACINLDRAKDALRSVFGFEQFRGVQDEVVDRVLAGRPTLAIMPTGAGKSLTYQLPATILPGTCVVISPADRADARPAARGAGQRHPAATLTSADADWRETQDAFRAGELDLLYVAPERASQPAFPRPAVVCPAVPVRDRRGALRVRMGARFPPRLPPAAPAARCLSRCPAAGADRDRRRAGPGPTSSSSSASRRRG